MFKITKIIDFFNFREVSLTTLFTLTNYLNLLATTLSDTLNERFPITRHLKLFSKKISIAILACIYNPSIGAHSEYSQISRMEFFVKIVKGLKPFTIYTKTSMLDV